MIAVIQRVHEANVSIEGDITGAIDEGQLILLGIEDADGQEDIDWLSKKVLNLRIFSDEEGVMNLSALDVKGEFLIVSQFTLHASTKKGNRPSYIKAAKPDIAIPLYEKFIEAIKSGTTSKVQTGTFGADMQVFLKNDGPVTIIIDTKNRT
ncbi:MAG: D-aminoacyl-tRNA deacylase [Cytophagales bacterium]|nr:D-aminoacyl-tRNA deacylase [Cytophagales bacterium]